MRTKTNEFLLALATAEYDIVMITETWLKDDISNSELALTHNIYHCDRNSNNSHFRRGGGVLIAVRHGIDAVSVTGPDCDSLEQVIVRIKLQHRSVYLFCVYFRPTSETSLYASHMSALDYILNTATFQDFVVVAGDYNVPNLHWSYDEDANGFLPVNASTEQELAVIESTIASGLSQMCSLVNVNGRVLNLIFINRPDQAELVHPPKAILNTDRHHHPSILLLEYSSDEPMDTGSPLRQNLDFPHCNIEMVAELSDETDWQSAFEDLNVDDAVSAFYSQLWSVLREHTPHKRSTHRKPYKLPWWNSELRTNRNLREPIPIAQGSFWSINIAAREYPGAVNFVPKNLCHEHRLTDGTTIRQRMKTKQGTSMCVWRNAHRELLERQPADLFAEFFSSVYSPQTLNCDDAYFESLPTYNIRLPQPDFTMGDGIEKELPAHINIVLLFQNPRYTKGYIQQLNQYSPNTSTDL
ncbi:uncharacterized protein LOC129741589 [Uranotaenia lowii]|uniref:uncharacterized protein LOC129741589 n=1 Tax=Uranotaenia lowii TaxID=190385 RepID=UPI002478E155|nr:uncharacterized protein LOC129741589 [Uranotaenia lowii]